MVPNSKILVKPSGNVLVIFEEKGGDPSQMMFSRRKVSALCAHVSEVTHRLSPTTCKIKSSLALKCPIKYISGFKFASYGTPTGILSIIYSWRLP
ncbi:putative beta-galactosidase [Helianthus annuus]|nr:putative beta-galactosidase [Helianthus annuus]